jgi:autotransporter translocation and assembly factor TamB
VVRRLARIAARTLVGVVAFILILVGIGIATLETGWAKNRIRELIVHQANQYLTATLTIGRLEGSILRGIRLGDIRLMRDDHQLVAIDEISVSYSIRELFQAGTIIRRIRLTRPRVAIARLPDGRWDIAAIVKRERREGEQSGPGRPIEVQAIEIQDGRVQLAAPLDFGAAHCPTDYDQLNASLAFTYVPVRWRLDFTNVSFVGRAPELTMTRLSGSMGNGPTGWFFDKLSVETPRSSYIVNGRVVRGSRPTELDMAVRAARFSFQEWSGVLHGLQHIAVDASFDTALKGPLASLGTDIDLRGTGGSVKGRLTLDTTVPGWHATGDVALGRLDLARWLDRSDRPSDISGRVMFNLALGFGEHFPRGTYSFDGPHAMYMNYAADAVKAQGQIVESAVLISRATGTAYGAGVDAHDSAIGIESPFTYRFQGAVTNIDLRKLPEEVPVPHVESLLSFNYDVSGQFSDAFITGQASFIVPSTFLGASLGGGTFGSVDTSQHPIAYSGEGAISNVSVHHFGDGLDVGWMRDPRYAGTLSGYFRVDAHGSGSADLDLHAGGQLNRATMFKGTMTDAEVSVDIHDGGLTASYSGAFANIDPAVPFDDPRWDATLNGTGTFSMTVPDLLTGSPTLADYKASGSLLLRPSTVHGLAIDEGQLAATLAGSQLSVTKLEASGPVIQGSGSGSIPLDNQHATSFDYDLVRADLTRLETLTGRQASGLLSSKGHLTGPWNGLHAVGDGSIAQLDAFNVQALDVNGHYDVRIPAEGLRGVVANVDAHGSFLTIAGQPIKDMTGTLVLNALELRADLRVLQADKRNGTIVGVMKLRPDDSAIDVTELTIGLGHASWRLQAGRAVTVHWSDAEVSITPATIVGGNGDEHVSISGTWRTDGRGTLRITATHVFLDSLQAAFDQPTLYGGVLDGDVTITGTRQQPTASGTLGVTSGRVDRVSYQKLAAKFDYAGQMFTLDARLDQSPGVWLTATGTVPMALLNSKLEERPIDVAIESSGINLGLLEGLTNDIRNVSGQLLIDVRVLGTSRDPHFTGAIGMDAVAFQVTSSGASYKNGRVGLTLTTDRVSIDAFRIEDAGGQALELRGSLGTHELRVGDLAVDVKAQKFEVLKNQYGRLAIDAALTISGRFEAPEVTGDLTISSGDVKIDEILQRALFQPYATEEANILQTDAIEALNPWQRLGLNLTLHVPNTLRLSGDNLQLTPGTPIGVGDIRLRVAGDLYLYKDPQAPLYVTGSFDSMSGSYAFQGRRFDVDPTSAIVFRGDLSPELYVAVTRTISGVQTRVGVVGPMREPELRLTSVPPLDESDILSLIVFNTSTNNLSAAQQQQLAIRAGALAAGFLATPIISAISSEIGLDILEIEPGDDPASVGARVTVGQEVAPGLVARFSRQFGPEPYDEATVEYALSRIIRLRATFTDAQTLNARSPFRRIERAGVDLLFFFSF